MGAFARAIKARNLTFAGAIMTGQQAVRYDLWQKRSNRRDGRWHASTVLQVPGQYCARECILDLSYIRQDRMIPDFLKPILKNGWGLHEGEQDVLSYNLPEEILVALKNEMGIDIPTTIPEEEEDRRLRQVVFSLVEQFERPLALEVEKAHWREEYNLAFTPDGILNNDGVWLVWEIKGYKHETFVNLSGVDSMQEPAYAKAVHQANFYVCLLRKEPRFYSMNHFGIYIIDKSNSNYLLRIHEYDPYMAVPYISRLEELIDWKALHEQDIEALPERICASIDDERALNCPFREACFKSSAKERVQWLKSAA